MWTFSTGVVEGHEAPPIINNGVMFVATPMGQVIALNAKTGDEYWRYKRELPDDLFQLHPTNRGVGLWQDKLYLATTDDHLVALDAKTGKVVWDTKVQDYKKGQYLTLMPLVVDGKVIVGGSGGEFGVRGYVVAYDANTGKELWRTFTIPGPGEPGHETWSGDDWKSGGAPAWMTGNYDTDTRTIYWGTGNAAPWPGNTHPGDNLYSTSVLALDPDTGKIKTHFQYHQNDSWDWDEVDAPMLVDLERDGRTFKSLIHPGRNAIFWVLERKPDSIKYVAGWPFVHTDVWKGIEPESGRPIVDPAHKPVIGKRVEFCPSLWGGKDWPSAAYSQRTKLVYVPANENFCGGFTGEKVPLVAWQALARDQARGYRLDGASGRHPFWRAASVGSGHREKGLVTQFPQVTAVRFGYGHRGRPYPCRRHQRPDVPRLPCQDRRTALGAKDQLRDHGHADRLRSGWDGVYRCPVGLGRRRAAHPGRIGDRNNVGVENNVPQGGVVWVFAVKK